jgi:Protein of unknown function (DUF3040)
MLDDEVRRAIADIERNVQTSDPQFVARFDGLERRRAIMAAAIGALLAASAALLTVGLAMTSPWAWASGLLALVGAVVVDHYRARLLRQR